MEELREVFATHGIDATSEDFHIGQFVVDKEGRLVLVDAEALKRFRSRG